MDAASALIAPPSTRVAASPAQLDMGRVRDIVLVRIATAGKILTRSELADELWSLVSHLLTPSDWRLVLDRDLGALVDAGLCEAKRVAVSVTEPGRKRAALVLGVNILPRSWADAKAGRLVAKALGIDHQPQRRIKALLKIDGLRAAIVQHAFGLKVRGIATPARLRAQLAKVALSRAFGSSLPDGVEVRSGLSARVGRGLAGRLAHPARDFATDSRLIAALAAETAGAAKGDLESLQTALLRRYVTRGRSVPSAFVQPMRPARTKAVRVSGHPGHGKAGPSGAQALSEDRDKVAVARPDLTKFVAVVRSFAHDFAEGWPGNRKTFISKVWGAVRANHPEWGVGEIEFKAMLTEAHRVGQIVLANADLKDQRCMAEIQASAIAYKNAIFHYVRVDD